MGKNYHLPQRGGQEVQVSLGKALELGQVMELMNFLSRAI